MFTQLCKILNLACLSIFIWSNSLFAASDGSVCLPSSLKFTETEKAEQRVAGQQLKTNLLNAISSGEASFIITEPRHYRFENDSDNSPITISGSTHEMTIDFGGSTFWIENSRVSGSAVEFLYIGSCKNLTIKNMYVDWDPLPYVQGKIVAVYPGTKEIDILLDEDFQTAVSALADLPYENVVPWVHMFLFDPITGKFKDYQCRTRVIPFFKTTPISPRTYRTECKSSYSWEQVNVEVGDLIAIHLRGSRPAICLGNSKNITLDNITLYSATQVGFYEGNGVGPNYYTNCAIKRRPGTTRLMSIGADGIHSVMQHNGPIIKNGLFEYAGDDGVHVHGSLNSVLYKENSTTYILALNSPQILKNDSIDFYTWDGLSYLGKRNISSWERVNDWNGETTDVFRVTLSSAISLSLPAVYSMDCHSGRDAIVEDCTFREMTVRGVLVMSPDMTIKNNYFEHIGAPAVQICDENAAYWRIGVCPYGTRVIDNKTYEIGFLSTVLDGENFKTNSFGDREPYDIEFINNISLTSPLNSMVLELKLDEGSGSIANDSAWNNNGTIYGAAWVDGMTGSALSFDGSDDYVNIPNASLLENVQQDSYTLSAWFKPDSVPANTAAADRYYSIIGKQGYHIGISYTYEKKFSMGFWLDDGASKIWVNATSSRIFETNNFYLVTGVVDKAAGKVKIYVNGLIEGESSFDASIPAYEHGENLWKIGGFNTVPSYAWYAHGVIDDVRIYNYALQDDDIQKTMTRTITVRPTDDARLYDVVVQDGVAEGPPLNGTDQHLNVGDWTSDTLSSAIFVVELPDFPAGESIDSAEMGWFLNRITTSGSQPNLQVDLFFKDTGMVEKSDYTTAAEASMVDLMTPASTVLNTHAWSDATLVSALQGVYNGGATPALSHAVFRLRWQGPLPAASDLDALEDAYNIATVDHAIVSRRPLLTLTSILTVAATQQPPAATQTVTVRPIDDARLYDVAVQDGVADGPPLNAADQHLNIGDWTSETLSSAIFVVELPDLPAGESIDSARMGWFLNRITTSGSQPNLQVDLFFKDSGRVELSDYSTPAEASMVNFMTPTIQGVKLWWSDAALVSALQGVYNGGATPALSNAVFRLRWQGPLPVASDLDQLEDVYTIATVDHIDVSRRPALTFILVSAGYTGYTDLYGITGEANSAPEEDYDGDGQLNVYEYALGGDPTDSLDAGVEPALVYDVDDNVRFLNVVLTDPNADITYTVEQTGDLVSGPWTSNGWDLVSTNTTADPEFDEVEHRINGSDKDELFIRLKITQP